ncbi:MAG: Rpn family recombination-promoting nuclease/putative transposase [Treponema sp.]|nr:Rpn family recombination-promoting nuclease/putative transposase [Treponema sp.]
MPIELNTLSGVLYMGQINDISFTIGNRLVIVLEHQSTVNPNMPLRLLMYLARIYEKIIERRKLYKSALEKIPAPEFIVLYNGKKPCPGQTTLRLSDAFKDTGDLRGALPAAPDLELTVRVYNINKGYNQEMLEKSRTLFGYSYFVDKVRELERELSKEEAMKAAIQHCIEHDILKEFFEANSSEVFNMLLTEWDTEEAKEVWFEEGREEGLEQGAQNKQLEILALMEQAESLEDFRRLQAKLKGSGENTQTTQS